MKTQVLTAAVLAALVSRVALAASEGGDTWSEVQPAQQSTYSVLQSASSVDPASLALGAAFEGSEGGDTWSSVQALRGTSGQQIAQGRLGSSSTEYTSLAGGSEGGDTWSRFAYGTPATGTSGDRTVYVGPNSHTLNVAYGETVRFVAESGNAPERSFGWRFDVTPEGASFALSRVAPVDFASHNLRVFVSPDPLYAGG